MLQIGRARSLFDWWGLNEKSSSWSRTCLWNGLRRRQVSNTIFIGWCLHAKGPRLPQVILIAWFEVWFKWISGIRFLTHVALNLICLWGVIEGILRQSGIYIGRQSDVWNPIQLSVVANKLHLSGDIKWYCKMKSFLLHVSKWLNRKDWPYTMARINCNNLHKYPSTMFCFYENIPVNKDQYLHMYTFTIRFKFKSTGWNSEMILSVDISGGISWILMNRIQFYWPPKRENLSISFGLHSLPVKFIAAAATNEGDM